MKLNRRNILIVLFIAGVIGAGLFYKYFASNSFNLTKGKTIEIKIGDKTIMQTGDVRHSIPLDEIISGGPPKDGIPAIDNPKFISVNEADEFLTDEDVGLGLFYKGEARFYPFQIMVWHEIVNDEIQGDPLLISYCPLCFTGIVFDSKIDGQFQEFGVSGKLWKSNLLMYNRTGDKDTESLWSQVLGEAVVGPATGQKLNIIPSDIVKYSDWKRAYSNTKVLSKDTGYVRLYGKDPYGSYYTSEGLIFGSFDDDRLHPKEIIIGVEIGEQFKAYKTEALKVGITKDKFAQKDIEITKNEAGEVRMLADGEPISIIYGFWFSWALVHPETELYK